MINEEIQKAVSRATAHESEEKLLSAVPELESEASKVVLGATEIEDGEVNSICRQEILDSDVGEEEFQEMSSNADSIVRRFRKQTHASQSTKL